jgi:hypothetical protein
MQTLQVMPVDFRFDLPWQAYGRSSSWLDVRDFDQLIGTPPITFRRNIALTPYGNSVFYALDKDRASFSGIGTSEYPFLVKTDQGDATALSSGAGCALLPRDDGTLKVKRCGLGTEGFRQPLLLTSGRHIVEEIPYDEGLAGLQRFSDAKHECLTYVHLKEIGLCDAYDPLGVIALEPDRIVDADGQPCFGAALCRVKSDLRLDELLYMALSPIIVNLYASGALKYVVEKGAFVGEGVSNYAVLMKFSEVFNFCEIIGAAAGGAYRRMHDANYFRGRNSCWLGNEVVSSDGVVSIVDAEGGTIRVEISDKSQGEGGWKESHPENFIREIQEVELWDYAASTVAYYSWGNGRFFGAAATRFVAGFFKGYRASAPWIIPPNSLARTLQAHLMAYGQLREALSWEFR